MIHFIFWILIDLFFFSGNDVSTYPGDLGGWMSTPVFIPYPWMVPSHSSLVNIISWKKIVGRFTFLPFLTYCLTVTRSFKAIIVFDRKILIQALTVKHGQKHFHLYRIHGAWRSDRNSCLVFLKHRVFVSLSLYDNNMAYLQFLLYTFHLGIFCHIYGWLLA